MSICSTLREVQFWGRSSFIFYPEHQKIFLFGFFCSKNRWANGPFFKKNHGPTPLQNVHFLKFFRTYLAWCKKYSFLSRITKNVFFSFFCSKKTHEEKVDFFDKNHGLTPLQNVDFFDYVRTSPFRSKTHSFLSRRSKNVSFCLS